MKKLLYIMLLCFIVSANAEHYVLDKQFLKDTKALTKHLKYYGFLACLCPPYYLFSNLKHAELVHSCDNDTIKTIKHYREIIDKKLIEKVDEIYYLRYGTKDSETRVYLDHNTFQNTISVCISCLEFYESPEYNAEVKRIVKKYCKECK